MVNKQRAKSYFEKFNLTHLELGKLIGVTRGTVTRHFSRSRRLPNIYKIIIQNLILARRVKRLLLIIKYLRNEY